MGEGTTGEGNAADSLAGLQGPHLGDDAALAKVCHQEMEAAELKVASEDDSNAFGLSVIDRDLAVLGVVAERGHAADPEPLALGGRDLVADALGGNLPLELGEGQQHIQ